MDRRHEKHKRRANRQTKRSQHPARPTSQAQALRTLVRGLDDPHPLPFLAHASGLWGTLTAPDSEVTDPVEFLHSLMDTPAYETTALLTVVRQFVDDDLLARRIGQELATRTHRLPAWITRLDDVTVSRVSLQSEPLGDGDQYWFELRWPDGQTLSVGALLDANWGQAFKDLMTVPAPITAVEEIVARHGDADDITFTLIDPADARAQVVEAVARTDMFYPPLETESWPQGRPLLTWVLRKLPEDGVRRPEFDLDERARQAIVDDFMASPDAKGLGRWAADTVDTLVWFAGFNCGDPLRWSPVKLEMLLLDWWHRKVVQPEDAHRALLGILRAFVRWSGRNSGLPPRLIDVNLAAIDQHEAPFLAEIGTPRRDTATELALIAAGFEPDDDGPSLSDVLARMVGGHDALDSLDTASLPDEPFDEAGIDPDILPLVRSVLADVEAEVASRSATASDMVTAARRMVERLARNDPTAWRRRASPTNTACAIAYLLFDMNHVLGYSLMVKELVADFGLKAAPQSRIDTFRRALRLGAHTGDPALMTGAARAHVLDLRERWKDLW